MINAVFLKKIKGLKFNGFQSLDWYMCMQEGIKKYWKNRDSKS
jgi:hypothetical protein